MTPDLDIPWAESSGFDSFAILTKRCAAAQRDMAKAAADSLRNPRVCDASPGPAGLLAAAFV